MIKTHLDKEFGDVLRLKCGKPVSSFIGRTDLRKEFGLKLPNTPFRSHRAARSRSSRCQIKGQDQDLLERAKQNRLHQIRVRHDRKQRWRPQIAGLSSSPRRRL